jgi:hypothetical protein
MVDGNEAYEAAGSDCYTFARGLFAIDRFTAAGIMMS